MASFSIVWLVVLFLNNVKTKESNVVPVDTRIV